MLNSTDNSHYGTKMLTSAADYGPHSSTRPDSPPQIPSPLSTLWLFSGNESAGHLSGNDSQSLRHLLKAVIYHVHNNTVLITYYSRIPRPLDENYRYLKRFMSIFAKPENIKTASVARKAELDSQAQALLYGM